MSETNRSPCRGDTVELIEKPTGCTSRHYNLTVGKQYEVLDLAGSCVITTTDTPGENGMYHRGRVRVIKASTPH